jgi:protein phosphatase 2C family protein 2/3
MCEEHLEPTWGTLAFCFWAGVQLEDAGDIPSQGVKRGSIELMVGNDSFAIDASTISGGTDIESIYFASPQDLDGDAAMNDQHATAPVVKSIGSVGNPEIPTHPSLAAYPRDESALPEQLSRQPEGDAPSDAVKVEGLMDTSESPLK